MKTRNRNKLHTIRNNIFDKTIIILSLYCLPGIGFAALANNATLLFPTDSHFDFLVGYGGPDLFGNPVISYHGIQIGQVQPGTTDQPNIDHPFYFLGDDWVHQTTSSVNILSDDNAGNVTLDFSGWAMRRGSDDTPIHLGELGSIATLTCTNFCENGDTYSLEYDYFMGNFYSLRLQGTISSVPLPGAIWLFLSGLISLCSFRRHARRSRNTSVT